MGITTVVATITNLEDRRKKVSSEFLVDTGAKYTIIPAGMVKQLDLKSTRTQKFSLADGRTVTRKLGAALIKINGHTSPTTVVLGQKKDTAIMGVVTFEEMGLLIDPFSRELRPAKLMLA